MSVEPCPSPVPSITRGIVVFDPAAFKVLFPAFVTVADPVLTGYFDDATMFLNNSCCSVMKDANKRERLLNLLVAHIAALLSGENGNAPSGLVGRVDKATEGSVSVSAAYASQMSMSAAYFSQTQYGAMFWMATTVYRTARYVAPPASGCVGRTGGYYGPGSRDPGGGCC